MRALLPVFARALLAFCLLLPPTGALAAEITVYTAAEPEMLQQYAKAIAERYPDITVKWIRDSGGPIVARLIAEKDAPRADVVFALTLSGMLTLEPLGLLEPYTAAEAEQLAPAMRRAVENPSWTPMLAWGAGLCVNTVELERRGLPRPESWQDLLKPEYKGLIVASSPLSSSTALLILNGWRKLMGEDAAWDYMRALDENIAMYTHSGCKPCQMAAQGEAVIGIASGLCTAPLLKRRAPLELVLPKEGGGWDMEASAVVNNGLADDDPKKQAARRIVDFTASEAVGRVAASSGLIPARTDCMNEAARAEQALFLPMDFAGDAAGREALLTRWRDAFDRR